MDTDQAERVSAHVLEQGLRFLAGLGKGRVQGSSYSLKYSNILTSLITSPWPHNYL
jgi:hypothetical protein